MSHLGTPDHRLSPPSLSLGAAVLRCAAVLRLCRELRVEVPKRGPSKRSRVVLLSKQKAVQAQDPSFGRYGLICRAGKVQEIHVTPRLFELSGASKDPTLAGLEFTCRRTVPQVAAIPRRRGAGPISPARRRDKSMATGVVLRATTRSVCLMLLFGSRVRSHMPYEATLTRWYGSVISSSKKMSSPSLLGLQLAVVYPTTLCLYWVKFREKYCWKWCRFG